MILGAQCYTLRQFMQSERDILRSLQKVASIGYQTVQISAIGPIAPHTLRAMCDDLNLRIVLTHIPEQRLLYETDAVLREHQTLGCRYIGLGSMPERYRAAPDWTALFIEDFAPVARTIRDAGAYMMYHNHHFEFTRLPGGSTIMDAILDAFPADTLGVTLDTYWLQAAGCDIYAWLDRLSGRIPCVHFKDMAVVHQQSRMGAVGDGNINFPEIIRRLAAQGGVEYALVEQDDCYGESPFDCLARSYQYLAAQGLR